MVDQLKGKKVPWSQLEEYLEAHQASIGAYVYQVNNKMIEKTKAETKLPKSFLQLHQMITKILRENDILPQ
jgi:rRNA pseudouridine-1189 N-methylase Emg1 (Nep1/Mra1 family)